MYQRRDEPDIESERLTKEIIDENFSDLHPRLSKHEASVEADRCYFCYDAPCVTKCPTGIDIPQFIRQISTDNVRGSAETIFHQNILGGMCARVCPTEVLCEQACVRNEAEGLPVKIGQLQRFATDSYLESGEQAPDTRKNSIGKKVAVVGAGPAGLSCAYSLACQGVDVQIFDSHPKLGGLNEYGIADYKTVENFAAREIEFILSIGGISYECEKTLGENLTIESLISDFDAVFLAIGLDGTNRLNIKGEESNGVLDAVEFIADLRQAADKSELPIGRKVVVIGGGMTAIDIAIQTKLLGADEVTICYRRGKEHMKASEYEQNLAKARGVRIEYNLQPKIIHEIGGSALSIQFERIGHSISGTYTGLPESIDFEADMIFKAVGQNLDQQAIFDNCGEIKVKNGKIAVDDNRYTGFSNVWAGGDCISISEDLTVAAVEDGKIAAKSIISQVLANAKH